KYLNNAVTEVTVAEQAHVDHYFVERDSEEAFNLTSLRIRQGRDSRFESHTALFGGSIVRNNVIVELAGENCDSTINGLFMGHGSQHMDNYMRVIHGAPNGDSRQFYKGILDDKSHGVFSGRIVVREGAQKTDAKQTNRNLLLSDDATVNTMPQLEIYADDVKCTHGATMGQLNKDAQFYLQARGIDAATARSMLIYAFAGESLERMNVAPIRDELEQLMLDRLPGGAKLKALIQ
ncbi:MAG: Fe-S cluster assembly protein SufD, partial [Phycisphaeraceae bacterium]